MQSSDLKKIENITDNEKEKILKIYNKIELKSVLEGAFCISPMHLYVLKKENGTNLVYSRYNIDRWKPEHYTDKDLINETRDLKRYMEKIYMKTMTKKILIFDIDPFKDIDKILEIADEYSRFFNISDYREIYQFHPSYKLGSYLMALCAIGYSTRRTSIKLRQIKYLDLFWKSIDGWYWKDILRTYYKYPNEEDNDFIDRIIESLVYTRSKGELEIEYGENQSNWPKSAKNNEKENWRYTIKKELSCDGNIPNMEERDKKYMNKWKKWFLKCDFIADKEDILSYRTPYINEVIFKVKLDNDKI